MCNLCNLTNKTYIKSKGPKQKNCFGPESCLPSVCDDKADAFNPLIAVAPLQFRNVIGGTLKGHFLSIPFITERCSFLADFDVGPGRFAGAFCFARCVGRKSGGASGGGCGKSGGGCECDNCFHFHSPLFLPAGCWRFDMKGEHARMSEQLVFAHISMSATNASNALNDDFIHNSMNPFPNLRTRI